MEAMKTRTLFELTSARLEGATAGWLNAGVERNTMLRAAIEGLLI
jgi:hypothetical protein